MIEFWYNPYLYQVSETTIKTIFDYFPVWDYYHEDCTVYLGLFNNGLFVEFRFIKPMPKWILLKAKQFKPTIFSMVMHKYLKELDVVGSKFFLCIILLTFCWCCRLTLRWGYFHDSNVMCIHGLRQCCTNFRFQ